MESNEKVDVNYDTIDKEYKIEYIKSLIQNLSEQKKLTMIFISFNMIVIAFLLDKIVLNKELPHECCEYKYLFIINIIIYLISTVLFTKWLSNIHRLHIESIDLFITLDIANARSIHFPNQSFYKKRGWVMDLAFILMFVAILFSIVSIVLSIIL